MARKKKVKKAVKKSQPKQTKKSPNKKFKIPFKKFIIFLIGFVTSIILYSLSEQEMYINIFFITAMSFGVLSLALLIALILLYLLKSSKK